MKRVTITDYMRPDEENIGPALKRAYADLPDGGVVFFPPGDYRLSPSENPPDSENLDPA